MPGRLSYQLLCMASKLLLLLLLSPRQFFSFLSPQPPQVHDTTTHSSCRQWNRRVFAGVRCCSRYQCTIASNQLQILCVNVLHHQVVGDDIGLLLCCLGQWASCLILACFQRTLLLVVLWIGFLGCFGVCSRNYQYIVLPVSQRRVAWSEWSRLSCKLRSLFFF
jgi:hypothetical protein